MRLIPTLLALPMLIIPCLSLHADDDSHWLEPNDLRVGYWLMPLKANIDTQTNGAQGYHKDGQFQAGGRFSLQWVLPISELSQEGGGLLSLEVSSTLYHQDQTVNDPEISLKTYVLTLHPDLAWQLGNAVHIEIGPFLGYGMSSVSSGSGHGTTWEYGARLATYWTLMHHFQIGLDLRYLGMYARQNFTYGASSEDLVIKTSGASGGVQLGWRF